ncbi:MAG: threonine-phosphate decarboxylase [Sedimentitalea sp.]|uniref:threonine-phosphate decarboxylase n=1 Tax=Sedimentitalea sp. TaxID=2048915 RepID=UPI0032679AF5
MLCTPTHTNTAHRDHGGRIDAAVQHYGGNRDAWIDLSTGINPEPYPLPDFGAQVWAALPDEAARHALVDAARTFWSVPDEAAILAAPGASALIARIPALAPAARVQITTPTYNEHAAAFVANGWTVQVDGPAEARVLVNPNNPDGRMWQSNDANAELTVIDESFCDVTPASSLVGLTTRPGCILLKSFGKFWGLAGLRLGFAIAAPETINRLSDMLGPWPVSGPALCTGAKALRDVDWAVQTRARLRTDANRLDQIMTARGAEIAGGTDLFRLYTVDDAAAWQDKLAKRHIWSRTFPYSKTFLRLGLPLADGWQRLQDAV